MGQSLNLSAKPLIRMVIASLESVRDIVRFYTLLYVDPIHRTSSQVPHKLQAVTKLFVVFQLKIDPPSFLWKESGLSRSLPNLVPGLFHFPTWRWRGLGTRLVPRALCESDPRDPERLETVSRERHGVNCTPAWSRLYLICTLLLSCPFRSKSDQFQISPAASPELLHHTSMKTWLFIAYSDERWLYYQFSLPHYISVYLSIFRKVGRMHFLNLGVKGLML